MGVKDVNIIVSIWYVLFECLRVTVLIAVYDSPHRYGNSCGI